MLLSHKIYCIADGGRTLYKKEFLAPKSLLRADIALSYKNCVLYVRVLSQASPPVEMLPEISQASPPVEKLPERYFDGGLWVMIAMVTLLIFHIRMIR